MTPKSRLLDTFFIKQVTIRFSTDEDYCGQRAYKKDASKSLVTRSRVILLQLYQAENLKTSKREVIVCYHVLDFAVLGLSLPYTYTLGKCSPKPHLQPCTTAGNSQLAQSLWEITEQCLVKFKLEKLNVFF